MKSVIRIGVSSQKELPKQLEVMIETIFREQFRKLSSILGPENLALVCSVDEKFGELACISAVEEGLILELSPFNALPDIDEEEVAIKSKIHAILEKQPGTIELDEHVSETDLIGFCDIMIFAFDKSDLAKKSQFERMRELFFENELANERSENLLIEINCPKRWTPDADGEVHFEYITQAPGRPSTFYSEIEIPGRIIMNWIDGISAIPH